MSRYSVNKALWQVSRHGEAAQAYLTRPDEFLTPMDLTFEERDWLATRNYAAMFLAGANPFLLYTFRIIVSGGWSWQLMVDHAASLSSLEPPHDITT